MRLGWPAAAMQPLREPGVSAATAARRRPPPATALRRLSTWLWRHGHWLTLLLLLPPLLWLGVVYLGSLLALLAHSFFRLDEFSGQVVYEWGLTAYVELLTQRGQSRHHPAHRRYGRGGDRGQRRDRLPDRLHGRPLRRPAAQGAVLSRRHAAALVELSRARLCLEADPGQGGRDQLGRRRHRHDLAARRHPGAAGDRRAVPVGLLSRHVPGVHLHLAAVHDPAGAGGARARAGLADRGRGRPRRQARPDLHAP